MIDSVKLLAGNPPPGEETAATIKDGQRIIAKRLILANHGNAPINFSLGIILSGFTDVDTLWLYKDHPVANSTGPTIVELQQVLDSGDRVRWKASAPAGGQPEMVAILNGIRTDQ